MSTLTDWAKAQLRGEAVPPAVETLAAATDRPDPSRTWTGGSRQILSQMEKTAQQELCSTLAGGGGLMPAPPGQRGRRRLLLPSTPGESE